MFLNPQRIRLLIAGIPEHLKITRENSRFLAGWGLWSAESVERRYVGLCSEKPTNQGATPND